MGQSVKTIAVICNYKLLPERIGGMDYFFWLFDQKCKANNIAVHWFFPNYSEHGGYHDMTIFSSEYQNVEVFFYAHCQRQQTQYTHIITHFVELCVPVFKKIKKTTSAQIIQVDHNPRPNNGFAAKKNIKRKIKGLLYSQYIDLFVGVSDYCKNQLVLEYGSSIKRKTIVIFNGLEIDKFKKKSNFEFKGKFIVASHLREQKGIQDLISAVHQLVKEAPYEFVIDLYGSGDYQEVLQKMVVDFSLQNYFVFKGSVDNLHVLYHQYDYLIHPSHGETFCYSVLESLLSDLPVITTKNQGNVLGMVVENENGFLFEREDIAALQSILVNILTGKKRIQKRSTVNDRLSQFSLDAMVANYYKLIE
ncbi:glycosyltransferase [Flavobacterium silvisoli]|uniref:Glycosyltransferase n=1 Tax=Flavobacterium silvisoli TaxID=2529433 RepID=A0A4Q9Z205_9FLAO|nr:glycosyltransferase family 4 protein [Flavobacterium silvisoli]TBX69245.1 glycosyltransferase [Flavobacterium silvisoli]